ncbi:Oidioi.mRNA.OKI2018_I69.chr2.g5848.t1.cds [Oikopleura dioica]|uniref:Oidioi.mRNA.OKI2018_I69.chr2.g5848.t1.cds n=1 Tax=Oikopleura dioica TaxID=34765 RepID=A0ABN7T5Z5_OIKDI|nr:Oidioi.mRNA.OKI2018_I69.chr2.g5848.t1.cds [Oikopleura dioica]
MGKYGYSVWMGGLPERVRSRDIDDFFKGYGKIVDISIKTKYAFIEFEDERDATDAVKDLDDQKLNGSRVRLEMSKGCKDKYRDFQRTGRVRYRSYSRSVSPGRRRHRSRSPYGGRGRSRSRSPARGYDRRETFYSKPAYKKYGAPEKTRWTVEVDNLSSRCSWQDLKDFMRKAGEVTYGDAHGSDLGRNRGVVCYEREDDARRAVEELDGRDFNGREVKLVFKVREEWGDSGGSGRRGRSRSDSRGRSRSRSRSPRRRSRSRSRSGRRERGSRDRSRDRSRSRDNKSREKSRDRSRSRSKSNKRDSRSRSR